MTWSRAWALDAAERCLKTLAQTLLAMWGADAFNLTTVAWLPAIGVAGGAALLSLLTSIVSAPVGVKGTPSLVPTAGRHARDEDE